MSRPLLLLVDDSREMGLIVACLGKRANWDVVVSVDAETAWDALSKRRPDLVLLDVNLPGASGPEWLRRVRTSPQFAGLPVALYTYWGLAADVAAGLDAGADFVFDKDLAARPADWQKRLTEIHAAASNDRCQRNVTVDWSVVNASRIMEVGDDRRGLMDSRIAGLNHALRCILFRWAPLEIARWALRQALKQTFAPGIAASDLDKWVVLESCGLERGRMPSWLDPDSLVSLSANLLEQMGRLLGADANSRFRDVLTTAVPGLSEFLAGS